MNSELEKRAEEFATKAQGPFDESRDSRWTFAYHHYIAGAKAERERIWGALTEGVEPGIGISFTILYEPLKQLIFEEEK